ncbi:SdiA-regulated domain-containing protein [Larkinella sp. VNQ87]|uniref:SdiA-regulated domain-containing protein n=1 Tax=Larkinella sp. VNQ87 TaxID=3400921 RepID=UPI003C10D7BA
MQTIQCYCLVLLGLLGACNAKKTDETQNDTPGERLTVPYDLNSPARRFTLPAELEEVSGLAYYKSNQLLCVQDEIAVAYIYDLNRKQIADSSVFGNYGDYEGIEWVKNEIYTLKSNGDLYHFKPFSKQIARIPTDLPGKTEVEGLAYDPESDRLMIAVKEGAKKDEKVVYMYDLKTKVVFKGLTLKESALKEAGIDAGKFKPSGLAVHPKTGDFYFLTAVGKRLVIVNRKGRIVASEPLDSKLFRQPEGICFAPDGTLYIASEGAGKAGYILEFANQP